MNAGMAARMLLVMVIAAHSVAASVAHAQDADRARAGRINYAMGYATLGVNYFWMETGSLPETMTEVLDAGFLPRSLKNPITGEPWILDPGIADIGELTYTLGADGYVVFSFVHEDGSVSDWQLDTGLYYRPSSESSADRLVRLYKEWALRALESYYRESKIIPESIDELRDAGYWPFTDEANPVTGEPLRFDSATPGNLLLKFELDSVRVIAISSSGGYSACALDPGQLPHQEL